LDSHNKASYRILLRFTGFYLVLPGFTEFYRVLPGFTGRSTIAPRFLFFGTALVLVLVYRLSAAFFICFSSSSSSFSLFRLSRLLRFFFVFFRRIPKKKKSNGRREVNGLAENPKKNPKKKNLFNFNDDFLTTVFFLRLVRRFKKKTTHDEIYRSFPFNSRRR